MAADTMPQERRTIQLLLRRIIARFDEILGKHPTYTTIIVWIVTSIITVSLIIGAVKSVLLYDIPVWYALIGAPLLYVGIRYVRSFDRNERATRLLRSPRFALVALSVVVIATLIVREIRKDERLVVEIDRINVPYLSPRQHLEFDAAMSDLYRFHEIHAAGLRFPDLLVPEASDDIERMQIMARDDVAKSIMQGVESGWIIVELLLHNRIGEPVTVYKVTGALRIGSVTRVFNAGVPIRMRQDVVSFSPEYFDDARTYLVEEFTLEPGKLTIAVGDAGVHLSLGWDVPSEIRDTDLMKQAVAFQFRKDDIFSRATDSYQYYLAKIYEDILAESFDIPRLEGVSIEDFSAVGIELTVTIFHTFGEETVTRNLVVGVLATHEPDDLLSPYGEIRSGFGTVDRLEISKKGQGSVVELDRQ